MAKFKGNVILYKSWSMRLDKNIEAIVNKCNSLALKINEGERYRISKSGFKGSLWLQPQKEAYRLRLTGDVKSILSSFVISKLGH